MDIFPVVQPCWTERAGLFQGLDNDLALQIKHAAVRRKFGKGDTIYLQEDEALYLYVIESGYVRLSNLMEDSSTFVHAIITAGESFGELGVFQCSAHADTACALNPVTLYRIRREVFHSMSEHSVEIRRALAFLVAERYRSYIESARRLLLQNLSARLAHAILRLVDSIGEPIEINGIQGLSLSSTVTQSDIGAMARGTRSNINRRLKEWERAGVIAIRDRAIVVLNRRRLEGYIEYRI